MHDPSAAAPGTAQDDPGLRGTDESTLVLRAQDGDLLAFALLLESHGPRITALCREILHHEAEAELIVEETFLTAWRRLDALQRPEEFPDWLSRMAAHHSLFVLRKQPVSPDAGDPVQAAHTALLRLPVEEHLAWLLHAVDGQTPEEIAEILEVAPQRVRERIRRAQRALLTDREGQA
ncbi:sigma factor-like helix-turn-helix DNA-binding protein [Nesterenkonia sandarakina]|uniref:RNA polymerase sigma-70 factor (ECF subfamily) n=1 Tax=Nesterenkonia sandarakina TaxID=272918 RepID=A0A7Z0E7R2_9MICC|nr:RNA polymerase sigma-70 factor (ECF subfamily) [Nesterenkonia sandarakina]